LIDIRNIFQSLLNKPMLFLLPADYTYKQRNYYKLDRWLLQQTKPTCFSFQALPYIRPRLSVPKYGCKKCLSNAVNKKCFGLLELLDGKRVVNTYSVAEHEYYVRSTY
jgi:hypothetical protein